jgi:hypothetical protein
MDSQLLTTKEAAKFLGMSEAFLERDRWEGNRAPGGAGCRVPFVRVGKRAVRYNRRDLEAYVHSQIRSSTSQSVSNSTRKQSSRSLIAQVAQAIPYPSKAETLVTKIAKALPKVSNPIDAIVGEVVKALPQPPKLNSVLDELAPSSPAGAPKKNSGSNHDSHK